MMQEAPPSVCSGNDDFGRLQEFLLIHLVRSSRSACEERRGEALAWVSRRYRIAEATLESCDEDLDAIRGWTVEQLKSLIRLAK